MTGWTTGQTQLHLASGWRVQGGPHGVGRGTPGSEKGCPVLISHQGHTDAHLLKLINRIEATSSSAFADGWHKLIFVLVY